MPGNALVFSYTGAGLFPRAYTFFFFFPTLVQVCDALEQLSKQLPPVEVEGGEERERKVEAWLPKKAIKAWNPK